MLHALRFAIGTTALVLLVPLTLAQESKAAKATRQKLKQVIAEFDAKEIGLKVFLEDVNRELDKGVKFKIDNLSGISNNSRVSFKGKKVTVEKILNDISDKYEFGWYVVSNPDNNKIDGWIILRKGKGKERGYEAGKEPKGKQSSRFGAPMGFFVGHVSNVPTRCENGTLKTCPTIGW